MLRQMITLFFVIACWLLIAAMLMPSKQTEPILRNQEWRNGRNPVFIKRIGPDHMDAIYGKAVPIK